MARFDSIEEMTEQATFAGWRFDRKPGFKITPDCDTPQAAGGAIQSYARNKGLEAQNVDFYIVKETTSYVPLTKTKFTILTETTPAR